MELAFLQKKERRETSLITGLLLVVTGCGRQRTWGHGGRWAPSHPAAGHSSSGLHANEEDKGAAWGARLHLCGEGCRAAHRGLQEPHLRFLYSPPIFPSRTHLSLLHFIHSLQKRDPSPRPARTLQATLPPRDFPGGQDPQRTGAPHLPWGSPHSWSTQGQRASRQAPPPPPGALRPGGRRRETSPSCSRVSAQWRKRSPGHHF